MRRCTLSGQELAGQVETEAARLTILRRVELLNGPPRFYPAFPLSPTPCKADAEEQLLEQWSRAWSERFLEFARSAYAEGQVSLAYEAAVQALVVDPNNTEARLLFGFSCRDGYWLTPYQAYRYSQGLKWDPQWGWVNEAVLARIAQGMTPVRDRWLPGTEAARLLRYWGNAYTLETDHYRIRTTADLADAVELAKHLEQLHWVVSRLLAEYFHPRDLMRLHFSRSRNADFKPPGRPDTRKFVVYLYRDASQFREATSRFPVPGVETATGIYVPRHKRIYCYVASDIEGGWVAATIHEATHQLLLEASSAATAAGLKANYWVAEGIPAYLESLRLDGDRVYVGEWTSPRLSVARDRLVAERRYVPLERFVHLTPEQFLNGESSFLYGQAALLVHFLLHGENGRYRQPFLRFLRDVFSGTQGQRPLVDYLGISYAELERRWVVHVARQDW